MGSKFADPEFADPEFADPAAPTSARARGAGASNGRRPTTPVAATTVTQAATRARRVRNVP